MRRCRGRDEGGCNTTSKEIGLAESVSREREGEGEEENSSRGQQAFQNQQSVRVGSSKRHQIIFTPSLQLSQGMWCRTAHPETSLLSVCP